MYSIIFPLQPDLFPYFLALILYLQRRLLSQTWWHIPLVPSFGKLRKNTVRLKLVWSTEQDCLTIDSLLLRPSWCMDLIPASHFASDSKSQHFSFSRLSPSKPQDLSKGCLIPTSAQIRDSLPYLKIWSSWDSNRHIQFVWLTILDYLHMWKFVYL